MKVITASIALLAGVTIISIAGIARSAPLNEIELFTQNKNKDLVASKIKPPISFIKPFVCGAGFKTYSVSLPGIDTSSPYYSTGVRCVKFDNYQVIGDNIAGIYWYAEGRYWKNTYRNIGFTHKQDNPYGGAPIVHLRSAAITGNGEVLGGYIRSDAKFREIDGQKIIEFTHVIAERWTLEPDGKAESYSTALGKVEKCGNELDQMKVVSKNSNGVRCLMRSGTTTLLPDVWYGEGEWKGKPYKHVGFIKDIQYNNPPKGLATAIDICNISGNLCNVSPEKGIQITATMKCAQNLAYTLSKTWNEKWESDDEATLDCIK